MPVFYNFTQDGLIYSFDDVFVPADLFREGNLWAWGNNSPGRLGINDTINRSTPVTTFAGGTNWKQVSSGGYHTAAIKTDGTLWVWGQNDNGQLGNNTVNNIITPITTFSGGTNWKEVACGRTHTVAIKTDGTLWTWGASFFGGLGNNDSATNRCTPVTTFAGGTNWRQVAAGTNFSAAIKTDGTLWLWGRNGYGQIANTTTTTVNTPVTTFSGGTNWRQISCAGYHTAAIKTDGTLWTWGGGFANSGGLGINDTINRLTPVTTFAGGTNWKQVASGGDNTAAIKTDGTLWVWGNSFQGALGNEVTTSVKVLTPVTTFAGGTNWKQVASGRARYTIAIKTDGTLWTWGSGADGKLGVNDISDRSTPVTTFAGGTNWKQVASGGAHTVAVTYIDPVI
jgi:alpha-tubulin suppressor-like RCC1 family protein